MVNSNTVKINDDEFVELSDLIYKHAGITFTINKKYLIENRLSRRLNELNFNSFKDYLYFLKYDPKGKSELNVMINLVTINETYFLREKGQIEHMAKVLIPQMIKTGKKSFKIFSAACSTGEEPYSIAIMLNEAGLFSKAHFDIIGVDINYHVIETAKKGEYRTVSFRGVPSSIQNKYFKKNGFVYELNNEIKSQVRFFQGNLMETSLYSKLGKVDFIFCRNVLIYFDINAKKRVIDNFHRLLNTPGYLFLGHSETLSKISTNFTMNNFGGGIVYIKEGF